MHLGGGLANDDVRGDDPSAAGHGVSPVILAPAGTGAALGGPLPAAAVVGVVLEEDDDVDELFLPPPLVESTSVPMTMTARTPPTMARFCICRRRCALRISSW